MPLQVVLGIISDRNFWGIMLVIIGICIPRLGNVTSSNVENFSSQMQQKLEVCDQISFAKSGDFAHPPNGTTIQLQTIYYLKNSMQQHA